LAEIAPDWRHPILGQTVMEMLNALPENERLEIRQLSWLAFVSERNYFACGL